MMNNEEGLTNFVGLFLCNLALFKYVTMGLVYADITLINGEDLILAKRHYIGEEEIKQMNINMPVDTGSYNLCINEEIQAQLQFPVVERRNGETADGRVIECDVVDNVQVRFKNRATTCRAMVLIGNCEPLLGAIPLEDMDVLIHPQSQQLIINPDHPFYAQMKLK
jgi:clan AA aspartic protease